MTPVLFLEPDVQRCKVIGEPQSQLMWKREDGRPLEQLAEQQFRHQLERPAPNQVLSVDSSELVFNSFSRNHSGVYLVSVRATD